jgi:hypothetical protein
MIRKRTILIETIIVLVGWLVFMYTVNGLVGVIYWIAFYLIGGLFLAILYGILYGIHKLLKK